MSLMRIAEGAKARRREGRQGSLLLRHDDVDKNLNELSERVIGAAIEVHRHLGPGFLEKSYERALAIELELAGLQFSSQHAVHLNYKGRPIGKGPLDLLIEDQLVVELKSVDRLTDVHRDQVVAYLRATKLSLGLLINFNVSVLKDGIRRVVYKT